MKPFIIFALLAISLLAVHCRKESITETKEVVINPPVEITTVDLNGSVRDEHYPIQNAEVDVYLGQTKIATLTTDVNGEFSTIGYQVPFGSTVTLYARKEGFASGAKRVLADEPRKIGLNLKLVPKDQLLFEAPEYANPADSSLVMVSGYVQSPEGEGVFAMVALLYNVVESAGQAEADGAFAYTDENGYFEALLPRDSVFKLNILQPNFTNGFYHCQGGWLNDEDGYIANFLPVEFVGPFQSDTQLPAKTNGYQPDNATKVTAFILGCNGNAVTNGTVELTTIKSSFSSTTYIPIAPDGTFTYTYDLCQGSLDELRFRATDNSTGKKSDLLILTNITSDVLFGTITACN